MFGIPDNEVSSTLNGVLSINNADANSIEFNHPKSSG